MHIWFAAMLGIYLMISETTLLVMKQIQVVMSETQRSNSLRPSVVFSILYRKKNVDAILKILANPHPTSVQSPIKSCLQTGNFLVSGSKPCYHSIVL